MGVISGKNLSEEEMADVIGLILAGELSDVQIGAFLAAMACKTASEAEIAGAARAMRDKAVRVTTKDPDTIDTCGTGGDGVGTFNISTVVALVAAGAGLTVVKHGNRSVSSKCGSADVLETLGVKIDADPSVAEGAVNTIGVGFLFAPKFHSAMRYVMPTRRELGVRTMFNLLGPLANPANAKYQLVGIYDPTMLERYAGAMKRL
ncbi:MAG: anthranilate phosphoribosyltransferase, partial [Phycisphaerales bacterium]|nr:anthranilate phosphoribosyltransferase [Phycisphaerales bacterium]